MNGKFIVPTAITTSVSCAGNLWWLIAYLGGWGLLAEGLFLGMAVGGFVSAVFMAFAEPIEEREGQGR